MGIDIARFPRVAVRVNNKDETVITKLLDTQRNDYMNVKDD